MHPPRAVHAICLQAAWEPPAAATAPWTRRFGRPSGVEAGQQVWLVVAGARTSAAVSLNAIPLPAIVAGQPRWAHDVTPLLRDRNVLELYVAPPLEPADRVGDGGRRPAPVDFGSVGLEIIAGPEMPVAVSPTRQPRRA